MPQPSKKQNDPTKQSVTNLKKRIEALEMQLKTIEKDFKSFKQKQTTKLSTRADVKTADELRKQILKQA